MNVNLRLDWRRRSIFIPGKNRSVQWETRICVKGGYLVVCCYHGDDWLMAMNLSHPHSRVWLIYSNLCHSLQDSYCISNERVVWIEGIILICGLQMKWKYWKADVWLNQDLGGIIYFHISVWEKCSSVVLCNCLRVALWRHQSGVWFDFLLISFRNASIYNSHIWDLCTQNLKYASDAVFSAKLNYHVSDMESISKWINWSDFFELKSQVSATAGFMHVKLSSSWEMKTKWINFEELFSLTGL